MAPTLYNFGWFFLWVNGVFANLYFHGLIFCLINLKSIANWGDIFHPTYRGYVITPFISPGFWTTISPLQVFHLQQHCRWLCPWWTVPWRTFANRFVSQMLHGDWHIDPYYVDIMHTWSIWVWDIWCRIVLLKTREFHHPGRSIDSLTRIFPLKKNMIRESRGGSFWKVWWGEIIGKFDKKYPSYIYIYIHIYLSDSESTQDPKPYKTQPTQQN